MLSYHLVEMPIRQRRALRGWHLLAALPIGVAVVVTALVLSTIAPAAAPVRPTKAGLFAVPATRPADLPGGQDVRVLLLGDSMALTLGRACGPTPGVGASPSTTRARWAVISTRRAP